MNNCEGAVIASWEIQIWDNGCWKYVGSYFDIVRAYTNKKELENENPAANYRLIGVYGT